MLRFKKYRALAPRLLESITGIVFSVLRALQAFLKSDAPTRAEAAGALRTLFVLAFWGQAGLATLTWGALFVFLTPEPAASNLTAQVLIGLGALELPTAHLLGTLAARGGAQTGALTAALLEGILLAAPVWSALFTWLIGSPTFYPTVLLGAAALFYGIGLLAVGRYAAQATAVPARQIQASP